MSVLDILAKNLAELMEAPTSPYKSTPSLEAATKRKGKKVAKSTIDRVLKAKTPFNLVDLETIAKVFNVEVWELLRDDQLQVAARVTPIATPTKPTWPFERLVAFSRFEQLTDEGRGVVGGAVLMAMGAAESGGLANRKAG